VVRQNRVYFPETGRPVSRQPSEGPVPALAGVAAGFGALRRAACSSRPASPTTAT